MFTRIKELCFVISTYGNIGEWRTGGFVASLFAVPCIYLLRVLFHFKLSFFYTIVFVLAALGILIIQGALYFITDKDPSVIMLDKTLGFALVFFGIAFNIKLIITGFFLFHFLNFIGPLLFSRLWKIELNQLPGALGIVASDIIAGTVINIFFRLIWWLAH